MSTTSPVKQAIDDIKDHVETLKHGEHDRTPCRQTKAILGEIEALMLRLPNTPEAVKLSELFVELRGLLTL